MIELGRFQIDLEMRTLRQGGEVVRLGSRAFDILAVVTSAAGRLVTKDELMEAVWPETVVEENNIQVHISALRKALGPDRDLIRTIPGRGYQLMQPQQQSQAKAASSQTSGARRLPPPKIDFVGRDAALEQIRAMLAQTHVLTLVGAGGIGKTSLAIEVARHAAVDFPEPPCLIELATLTTREAVLAAIVEGCGQPISGQQADVAQVAAALGQNRRLLLLDNAEHVIDYVAETVESLIAVSDSLRVLVTSREPLRIMPETVFRVDPLDVPRPQSTDTEILQHSAVDLFLTRANSLQGQVCLDSDEIRLVGEICRRLDGIPLAIELAAARIVALGVEGVYRRLDDRMAILTGGYRTALPRHQTLRATFDWSFALLDASTRSLFRRLAIFGGGFTFEAMCAVVCDAELTVGSVICGISELVNKSLVNVEFDGPVAKYRLPESTRAYALEKLQAEGEKQEITSRGARYFSSFFQARLSETTRTGADNSPDLRQTLDDARSAFDWALSPDGDPRFGVELASNLLGALLDFGMIEECYTRATQAVDVLENLPARALDAVSEMRVRAALASALPHVRGPVSKSVKLWRDVSTLALESHDHEFHARALWGLWNTMISCGNINESMKFARRFQQHAQENGTEWQQILADQLVAISLHCLGQHAEAKQRLHSARQRFSRLHGDARQGSRFGVDPLVFCNGTLARIAWLQGDPDEAIALVDTLVNLVRPEAMEPSLIHVLGAAAAPLALMSGDLPRATHYLEIMRSQAALHELDIWRDYCDCLSAYRDILEGRPEGALSVLEASLDSLIARGFRRLVTPCIIVCAEALVAAGRLTEASVRVAEVLAFCQSNGELFFLAEVWRAMGIVAQAEAGTQDRAEEAAHDKLAYASTCFAKAIELSRAQGARMWELRASMAMANLLHAEGRSKEASELLKRVAVHFEAESSIADVRALFELIEMLRVKRSMRIRRTTIEVPRPSLDDFSDACERVE